MSKNRVHYWTGKIATRSWWATSGGITYYKIAACKEAPLEIKQIPNFRHSQDAREVTCGACWRDMGMGKVEGVHLEIVREAQHG